MEETLTDWLRATILVSLKQPHVCWPVHPCLEGWQWAAIGSVGEGSLACSAPVSGVRQNLSPQISFFPNSPVV